MSLSFPNVLLCGQGTNEGKLEAGADSLHWTARTGDKSETLALGGAKAVSFYDLGRSCQLWVTDERGLHRFDGFRAADYDRLAGYFSGRGLTLAKRELSAKGRNWGTVRLNGGQLELVDDAGKLVAPIPLGSVAQAALPGKNELEVQFMDDDTVEREDETLIEMRLYVPPGHSLPGVDMEAAAEAAREKAKARAAKHGGAKAKAAGSSAEEGGSAEDGEEDDDGGAGAGGDGAANVLHSLVSDAAGIAGVSGEAIAELPEEVGQFLVPRGRYAVELYPTFMRLVGKTYEFKVAYKSVARMFYLDRPSSVPGDKASRYALVISLDDPVRHGSQRHPHLVMHLDRGAGELVVPVRLSDEDRAAGRYEGLCKDGATEVRGEAPKLVAMLLKNVTGKPVFRPGAYTSAGGAKCVRCSLKSSEGSLYPLDKSFLFIHKPTTYIRHGEVDTVEFQRSGGEGGASASAARTFDVAVHCKALGGGEPARTYVFAGIDRAEKEGLRAFLESRGLRVNEAVPRGGGGKVDLSELGDDDDDEDEEDDDDYAGEEGSDDDDDGGSDDGSDAGSDDEDAGFKKSSKSAKKKSSGSSKKKSSSDKDKGKGKRSASSSKGGDKKKSKKRRDSDDDEDDDDDE